MNEKQWRKIYEERLFEQGYTAEEAKVSADAAEYLEDIDPIEAADDEASYS